MKGKLIVLEGMDGSGKTTHTNSLVDWLKTDHHLDVLTLDFPGYSRTCMGQIIGAYLRGDFGDPVEIDPFQSALLYAGDRMAVKDLICNALNNGTIVVLNRYVPSNLVYGSAKLAIANRASERHDLEVFTNRLEYDLMQLPKPDLVVVLHSNEKIAASFIENKDEREYLGTADGQYLVKDGYEKSTLLQRIVSEQYQYFSLSAGWKIIHVLNDEGKPRPIPDIQKDIRVTIEKNLL